ncbi:MAG: phosphodiester glycosidase family protein [Microbacterium sp.]
MTLEMRDANTSGPSTHGGRRRKAGVAIAAVLLMAGGALGTPLTASAAGQGADWMPEQLDSWKTITTHERSDDVTVTRGVEHRQEVIDAVDGRVPINVVTADTGDDNVRLGAQVANDSVLSPENETLTSMAERTGAVAGINGGYFQINASGQANDGEIVDGEIWKSPTADHEGTVAVRTDGSVVYGPQDFTGSLSVERTSATREVTSVNTLDDATDAGITALTPRLSDVDASWFGGEHVVALGHSDDDGETITIDEVGPLESLEGAHYGVVGGDEGSESGTWIAENLEEGDTVSVETEVSPDDDIAQLIQGPGRILADGEVFDDPVNQMPKDLHPETAVGSTADGELVMVTLDGQKTADVAIGVGWKQVATYLRSLGVEDAVLLDGGGSTEMVVRQPGETEASVANTPSDGGERPVANGLFVYSESEEAGPASEVALNGGEEISTAAGATTDADAFATDDAGNPAAEPVEVTAEPAGLGTWEDGTFTAGAPGSGRLVARSGDVTSTVPLTVAESFESFGISPDQVGVANGATQTFAVTGRSGDAPPVTLDPASIDWKLDPAGLGEIDEATGEFTAAESEGGQAKLTATVGGSSATAEIAVGEVVEPLIDADTSEDWTVKAEAGAKITPSDHAEETDDVPPGSSQSAALKVDYAMPKNTDQHRIRFAPNSGDGVLADKNEAGQVPENLRFRFKVDSDSKRQSWIVLNVADAEGHTLGLWTELTEDDYGSWTELSKSIHRGVFTSYPLTIQDISYVTSDGTTAAEGSFTLGGMSLTYPATTDGAEEEYTPIDPDNPEWLQHEQSAADFQPGGHTYVIGDDGHLVASNPESTSALNIDTMVKRSTGETSVAASGQTVEPLPEQARPDTALSLGDISDTGEVDDLAFAKEKWETFGLPLYDVVGNHEISQGAVPQDTNFHDVFQQDTHFTFENDQTTFISLDNSTGSVLTADANQVPKEQQYPWFAEQLDAASTPVVIVGIHMPAYDPSPSNSSQFSDRWEAQQFLQLIQNYRLSHPDTHVLVMYGHMRAFANQLIDPSGQPADATTGIPQFVIGDIGMPPYMAADEGGFYHFGLFHVNDDGTVQYTVEPVLQSVTIDQAPDEGKAAASSSGTAKADSAGTSLAVGQTRQYTATAVNAAGEDTANPPTMPVADPMSHTWSSTDEDVASVDPVSGEVTALREGTTTVSVTTGGITDSTQVTVTADDGSDPGDGGDDGDGGSDPGDGGGDDGGSGDDGSGGGDDGSGGDGSGDGGSGDEGTAGSGDGSGDDGLAITGFEATMLWTLVAAAVAALVLGAALVRRRVLLARGPGEDGDRG